METNSPGIEVPAKTGDPGIEAVGKTTLTISSKLTLLLSLTTSLVILIAVFLVTWQEKRASLDRAKESGLLLGRMIAITMGEEIVRGNFQGLEFLLGEFRKLEGIRFCAIVWRQGKIIAATKDGITGKFFADPWSQEAAGSSDVEVRRALFKGEQVYDTSVPIIIGGTRYGTVRLGFPLSPAQNHIRELLLFNLSLGLIAILVSVFIAYSISKAFVGPLQELLGGRIIEGVTENLR